LRSFVLAVVVWLPSVVLAQPTEVSGFVDAAYHVDFLNPDVKRDQIAPFLCYTPVGNTFVLHSAHLAITHAFNDSLSATIELDAGFDAPRTASYPFSGRLFDVQEAYATYSHGIFSVTAGKFAGYEGLEVIEGPLNPTITRGYSFNLAEPNTHTGVKAHLTGDTVDVGLGVVNGWDTIIDNNDAKTLIARLGVTPSESCEVNVNGTFGPELENIDDEYRLSVDLNGAWKASERFALGFQFNFGKDGIGGDAGTVSWYVFSLQPSYTGEVFTFGARAEFFRDPDGARAGLGDTSLFNLTLTPGMLLGRHFKLRCELRTDITTSPVFGKSADPRNLLLSAAVGVDYIF
jgi:hypothetical protein